MLLTVIERPPIVSVLVSVIILMAVSDTLPDKSVILHTAAEICRAFLTSGQKSREVIVQEVAPKLQQIRIWMDTASKGSVDKKEVIEAFYFAASDYIRLFDDGPTRAGDVVDAYHQMRFIFKD